ncbi:unnamed protein product [Adineta steineri]|uniref:NAD(P)(+)--arginine ADP-ribosyltransferase n=1 Tax=Adineta steineri TaxID=433720 RepID=A0A813W8F5_9BILA|nr:unnamed protein product [Adineta steineri]CAF1434322.1 unnamed protein product [Adineta steineri]
MSGSGLNREASSSSSNVFMNNNNTTVTPSTVIQSRRRIIRNYSLLWLDECVDQTNKDYENTLKQIQTIAHNINVFEERDACIDFLTDSEEDIKLFLVIKDTISQQIMPFINDIPQLHGVYILSNVEILDEEWTKKWQKIKSVHTSIGDLCQRLELSIKQLNQDSISMSFITLNEMTSTDKLNQLEPTFMYTQIFKDILLDMEHDTQAIKQFTAYCRHHGYGSTKSIDTFEKKYDAETAIWWYTCPSFIYSMLNYALRSMEDETIINMGFFIRDLHQQLQKLQQEQIHVFHDKPFIVYRGQGLSKTDFEKLQKTQGGLISFNNFLSTSTEQYIPLGLASSASETADMVGILFKMLIDPRVESVPFASIKAISCFPGEDEILFSMHTIFRVGVIKQIENNNQLYQIELQLTLDDDRQLRLLTDRIREDVVGDNGWERLGDLLLKIGQFNKAEELYNVLLEQTPDEREKAIYYNQLGHVEDGHGDYKKAICCYQEGLEIQQKVLPSNHPDFAQSYHNIGSGYDNMGEYLKAISFYEKALEIRQKTLPSKHPDLATSYNKIGNVYNKLREHSKAFSYYEKALEIRQKTLSSNHPDLAASYNNIGLVYYSMGQDSKARSSCQQALDICQKPLSSNHPDLAASYNKIDSVYENIEEYLKALSYYEKAFEIFQQSLPFNHPDLAVPYTNIGLVYINIGEYSKALSFCEQALDICQKTLSSNHPDLAASYHNISSVFFEMGDYPKALSYYEKALEIFQKSLPSNHPSLAVSYNTIGFVYYKMGEYSIALSFYEQALEIYQKTLPSNHPDLAGSYNNIGLVYYSMEEYSKALSYYGKALEIQQKTLPSKHPDLATSYSSIGNVYKNMGEYVKALSYYNRALDIFQYALPPTHLHIKNVKESINIVKMKL